MKPWLAILHTITIVALIGSNLLALRTNAKLIRALENQGMAFDICIFQLDKTNEELQEFLDHDG